MESRLVTRKAADAACARRRGAEVSLIPGTDDCLLTSSLKTSDINSTSTAVGTMFAISARNHAIEILTLELSLQGPDAVNVEVYTSSNDDFVSIADVPDEWSLVANVTKVPREVGTTIIPVTDFSPVEIGAYRSKSFYVTVQSRNMLIARSEVTQVGQIAKGDSTIQFHSGIALFDYPFSDRFADLQDMNGVIHYRANLPCESARGETLVYLDYNVDFILGSLQIEVGPAVLTAVEDAVRNLMTVDGDLISYDIFHGLELLSASYGADFDDECPVQWQSCSKVTVTLLFTHRHSLTSGQVRRAVLQSQEAISNSVSQEMNERGVTSMYSGEFAVQANFFVTLVGVTADATMDHVQRSYFERITTNFLSDSALENVLDADVYDQLTEGSVSGSRRLGHLRHNSRQLQQGGTIVVGTTIYGASKHSTDEFITRILTTFADGDRDYARDLSTNIFLPGSISEQGTGDFFAGIYGTSARMDENSGPVIVTQEPTQLPEGTVAPTEEEPATVFGFEPSTAIGICSALMVISALWLCCFHKKRKKELRIQRKKEERKARLLALKLEDDESEISFGGYDRSPTDLSSGRSSREFGLNRTASVNSRDRSSRHDRKSSHSRDRSSRHDRKSSHSREVSSRHDRKSSHSREVSSRHDRKSSHSREPSSRHDRKSTHSRDRGSTHNRTASKDRNYEVVSSSDESDSEDAKPRRKQVRRSGSEDKADADDMPYYVSSSIFLNDSDDDDDSDEGSRFRPPEGPRSGGEFFGENDPRKRRARDERSRSVSPPRHSKSAHSRKVGRGLSPPRREARSEHVRKRNLSPSPPKQSRHQRQDYHAELRDNKSDHVRRKDHDPTRERKSKSEHVRVSAGLRERDGKRSRSSDGHKEHRKRDQDGKSKHDRSKSRHKGDDRSKSNRSRKDDDKSRSNRSRKDDDKSRSNRSRKDDDKSRSNRSRKDDDKSRSNRSRKNDDRSRSNRSRDPEGRSKSRHSRDPDDRSKSRRSRDQDENKSRHNRDDKSRRKERRSAPRSRSHSSLSGEQLGTFLEEESARGKRPGIKRSKSDDVSLMSLETFKPAQTENVDIYGNVRNKQAYND